MQFLVAEITLAANSAEAYLKQTIRKVEAADPAAMIDVLGVKAVRRGCPALAVVSRAMTLGGGWAFGRRGGLRERIFRDAQAASVMAPTSDVLKDFYRQGEPRYAAVLDSGGVINLSDDRLSRK